MSLLGRKRATANIDPFAAPTPRIDGILLAVPVLELPWPSKRRKEIVKLSFAIAPPHVGRRGTGVCGRRGVAISNRATGVLCDFGR